MENYLDIIGEWVCPDMSLDNPDRPYVYWKLDSKTVNLNGDFTADELHALACYMDPSKLG